MKRIITLIALTASAAVLMNSCQKSMPEVKEGVPMTIQASVTAPAGTKTQYDYTNDKTLEGSWNSEEAITVISFNEGGITAVDEFVSTGEAGRKKAEFSGTWTGNEGDKIICLYPPVDSYAGYSIFENVNVGSPFIGIRDFSTPSASLQDNDTNSVSDVDAMLGEVKVSGDGAHVYLEHLFAVFRIEVTLANLPYFAPDDSPYENARISSLRIKCVDPDREMDEWDDPVFVWKSYLNVTIDDYTGKPYTAEHGHGPQNFYLINSGSTNDFYMRNEPVTKTFYVPVRFDENLEPGYELCFQFGGYYYNRNKNQVEYIDVFPVGDKRKTITSKLPLENGKIYCFKVTI